MGAGMGRAGGWRLGLGLGLALAGRAPALDLGVDPGLQRAAHVRQTDEHWCWAASLEMALRCYGLQVPQREIVKRIYGAILGGARDHGGTNNDIVHALDTWTADERGRPFRAVVQAWKGQPSPQVLRMELTAKRPILLGLDVDPAHPWRHLYHAVVLAGGGCTLWPSGAKFYELNVLDPEGYGPAKVGADLYLSTVRMYWTLRITRPDQLVRP
jgi:hypothetical protein